MVTLILLKQFLQLERLLEANREKDSFCEIRPEKLQWHWGCKSHKKADQEQIKSRQNLTDLVTALSLLGSRLRTAATCCQKMSQVAKKWFFLGHQTAAIHVVDWWQAMAHLELAKLRIGIWIFQVDQNPVQDLQADIFLVWNLWFQWFNFFQVCLAAKAQRSQRLLGQQVCCLRKIFWALQKHQCEKCSGCTSMKFHRFDCGVANFWNRSTSYLTWDEGLNLRSKCWQTRLQIFGVAKMRQITSFPKPASSAVRRTKRDPWSWFQPVDLFQSKPWTKPETLTGAGSPPGSVSMWKFRACFGRNLFKQDDACAKAICSMIIYVLHVKCSMWV